MINAVIFDLDGVLIDSEPLHCKADTQLLRELGADPPADYFDRFAGWKDAVMWEAIKTEFHIAKSIDEIMEMQVPIKLNLLKEGDYKAIQGIVELLEEIKAVHIPIAIASSSPKIFIEAVVEKIGIKQYFKILISGEEIERSKPEPDIFFKAASSLNVNPAECLVVEDSKSGTIAARKAGMKCIGYQNINSGNQDLSNADFIVNDIREIDIRKLCGKMKAVVYNKKGVPDRLIYCDVEKPVPNDNEVLVKIVAVSANAADYRSMSMGIIPKRRIFGADIAGRVEEAGKNIRQFKPGDEVTGDLASFGFGGFAEYTVAPEKALILKPVKLSFEDAAALPMAALTALQALRNKGNIRKGQKVLIAGSGGGVGTFAVQLAKYFGAEVTAVCSTKNIEQTISLGADYVIDYTKEDFTKNKKCYDIILAVNGNRPLSSYRRILNPYGIYVMVGGALPQIFKSLLFGRLMSLGSKKMLSLAAKPNKEDLEFIVKLAEDGKIRPVIDRRYPLDKTAEAISYLREGHASGKVVINVD